MAKRFTDTEKWKDPWYISLDNDYRIIWQWLIDNCSHAGFCKRNMSLLNLMCRFDTTEHLLLEKMENRVLIVGNDWFIPKFIKFQYSTLKSGKPAILGVVKELFSKNCIGLIPESFGNDYIIIAKSYQDHCKMIKDKDKEGESKNEEEKGGLGGKEEERKGEHTALAPRMLAAFKKAFPDYPDDEMVDFESCRLIAYKIAKAKGWTKEQAVNGKQANVESEWQKMVDFIKSDKWYSTRSISAINKQFQDLTQAIKNGTSTKGANQSQPIPGIVTERNTRGF